MEVRSRWTLSDFLRTYPGFSFDVEEYLISTRCVDFLRTRFQQFTEQAAHGDGLPVATQILDWIKARGHASVPVYQGLPAARRIEDLPCVAKRSLRTDPWGFLCENHRSGHLWRKTTTGSSGPPIPIWYSAEFYFDLLLLSLPKVAWRAGLEDVGSRPVFCLSISDIRKNREFAVVDPTDRVGMLLQVVVDERQPESLDRVISLLDRLSPVCLSSKPSVFEMLLAHTWKTGGSGRAPEFLVSGGSLLSESLREALEERFGARVINIYGMTELGVVASECPRAGFHVDTSAIHVEILDEAGRPVPEGEEGEIVLSSIANRAMPLLRYRTGDLGRLTFERCACGSTAPRFEHLSGRRIDCFRTRSGTLFAPTYFNDLFDRFPVLREFQITQSEIGRFEVLVELSHESIPRESTFSTLERYIDASLPGGAEVTVAETVFRKDSKFERYRTCV